MNKRGFTLIEMLVVIAIVGLLSSVVVIGLGGARKQGRDARRISDISQIQNALEIYYTANGEYPTNDLTSMTNISKTDPRGEDYMYESDGKTYGVGGCLEESQTTGDDCSPFSRLSCSEGTLYCKTSI